MLDLGFASTLLKCCDLRCEVFNGLRLRDAGSGLARRVQALSCLDVSLYRGRLTRFPSLKLSLRLVQSFLSVFEIRLAQAESLLVSPHSLELITQGIHLHGGLPQHSILRRLLFGEPLGFIQSRLGQRQLLSQGYPRARSIVAVVIPAQARKPIDTGTIDFDVLAQNFQLSLER
ncbi:Uncharacterised protein [Burkholderia pseudomallei]|nr:Uncharacterised protein [Burkholderia pseudomallei]